MANTYCSKPLGFILREADLVTLGQIEVALQDQKNYQLPLGEILALHGWIRQETADFFVERWPQFVETPIQYLLGQYFQLASLLNDQQIRIILQEQVRLGIRFGAVAILKGWLKQRTVDYFVENLVPEAKTNSSFQDKPIKTGDRGIIQPQHVTRFTQTQESSQISYRDKSSYYISINAPTPTSPWMTLKSTPSPTDQQIQMSRPDPSTQSPIITVSGQKQASKITCLSTYPDNLASVFGEDVAWID